MPLHIVIAPTALQDLKETSDWYNQQQPGLGNRFLRFADNKFAALAITPGIGSVRFDTVRCTSVNVFSHLIYYIATDTSIIILRVLHSSRKPLF